MTPLRRLLIPFLMSIAVVGSSSVVHAQQSTAELESQINAAWRELEPVIEDHNRVRTEIAENKEKVAELEERLVPLELRMNLALDALNEVAVHFYKGGNMSAVNALLTSGSPTTFVDQLAVLDLLARDQRVLIEEVNEAKSKYEAKKEKIEAVISEQEEQEDELAARKDEIEAELDKLEDLLAEAQAAQATQSNTGTGAGEITGGCPAVTGSGPGYTAAQFACAQIGKPYVYGSGGPDSYDCSGLTSAAWAAAGVSLSHYTGAQWNEGWAVSRSELIPGDLVFFYNDLSHVGIYVGNGAMVDAPRSGMNVSMRSIDTMPIAGFRRPA